MKEEKNSRLRSPVVDGEHFDTWTRRQFGRAATGLLASLTGLAVVNVEAKKKHKKRRKKKRNAAALPVPSPQPACASGQILCGSQCVTGTCCPGEACGPSCQCGLTLEGDAFCFATDVRVTCDPCASSADCGTGFRCRETTDCEGISTRCFIACQTQPSETT